MTSGREKAETFFLTSKMNIRGSAAGARLDPALMDQAWGADKPVAIERWDVAMVRCHRGMRRQAVYQMGIPYRTSST